MESEYWEGELVKRRIVGFIFILNSFSFLCLDISIFWHFDVLWLWFFVACFELNYRRHDNLVKQLGPGGAVDRNQNRTGGDNQIWTTPGPPQATCSAQWSSTQVFVLFKIIKDSIFRNYFLKVMMGKPAYQAVSCGKIFSRSPVYVDV